MSLIKESHNTLFKELFDELAGDIGHSITVVTRLTGIECSYCYKDPKTGRSSGKAKIAWNSHPSYDHVGLSCPNCRGKGDINTESSIIINNVMIEDISGTQFIAGKFSFFDSGTRKLMGKLSDILVDKNDLNSATIFDTATEIIVYGEKHKVLRSSRAGLKERYLFETIIEKIAGI